MFSQSKSDFKYFQTKAVCLFFSSQHYLNLSVIISLINCIYTNEHMHLDIYILILKEMWCTRDFINVINVAVQSCMAYHALKKASVKHQTFNLRVQVSSPCSGKWGLFCLAVTIAVELSSWSTLAPCSNAAMHEKKGHGSPTSL